jgi:AcrR family transcriptional regulator
MSHAMARSPGRPRSEEARRAVLRAGARLVQKQGYGSVTVEGIAREAGVSKQTVYRWWPQKAAVVLEALNEGARAVAPIPDTGSLDSDLRLFIRRTVAGVSRNRRMLAGMMAEAQLDDAFGRSFRRDFLRRRREVLAEILDDARERGEIDETDRVDFVVEIVFGTLWYRILGRNAPLNEGFADRLTDAALAILRG